MTVRKRTNSPYGLWYELHHTVWNMKMPKDTEATIIDKEKLDKLLAKVPDNSPVKADVQWLEEKLLPNFRELNYRADLFQNRYRLVQLGYIILAFVATIIGSFQAVVANDLARPEWLLQVLSILEAVVALSGVFLAVVSNRDAPMETWLTNRRRAEGLRQECFRYLMNATPYNEIDKPGLRKQSLLRRVAEIDVGK